MKSSVRMFPESRPGANTFSVLPNEVLQYVFSYLGPESLGLIRTVNHRFRANAEAVMNRPHYWTVIMGALKPSAAITLLKN